MIFTYAEDGDRVPFNPLAMRFAGCLLCGGRARAVAIFVPTTEAMHAVVLRLRQHAQPAHGTACLAYGLCARCSERADLFARVERALEAAAAKVVVQ